MPPTNTLESTRVIVETLVACRHFVPVPIVAVAMVAELKMCTSMVEIAHRAESKTWQEDFHAGAGAGLEVMA
jgi:hypothetical protein